MNMDKVRNPLLWHVHLHLYGAIDGYLFFAMECCQFQLIAVFQNLLYKSIDMLLSWCAQTTFLLHRL